MIRAADAIAIVTIGRVEKTSTTDYSGLRSVAETYHQKASTSVEKVIKGTLPRSIDLYGQGDALCGPSRFALLKSGRSLVFLRHQGNLWVAANADLGIRPIVKDCVQWYGKSAYPSGRELVSLSTILSRITALLGASGHKQRSKH